LVFPRRAQDGRLVGGKLAAEHLKKLEPLFRGHSLIGADDFLRQGGLGSLALLG